MSTKTCPLCKKALSLQQVNLNLAVYICEDLKCKYPVGYDCTVVDRKLEDIDETPEDSAGKDNLDDWIHDVVANNEKPQPPPSVSVNLTNKNEDPAQWIDDLVAEAVNESRRYREVYQETSENADLDFDDFLDLL